MIYRETALEQMNIWICKEQRRKHVEITKIWILNSKGRLSAAAFMQSILVDMYNTNTLCLYFVLVLILKHL